MIVIVETNFILELVLQQRHSQACEELRAICSPSGATQLAIPAFAIAEAGLVLERDGGERRKFIKVDLARQATDIGSVKLLQRYHSMLKDLEQELIGAENESDARWFRFCLDIDSVDIIPLSAETLVETTRIQRGREIEQWPDALMFASVKRYLANLRTAETARPALFVSTDGAAFGKPTIVGQLRDLGCTYINSFENAVRHLRHQSR